MLQLFKEKLMPGMEIIKVKETPHNYTVTVMCEGKETVTYLHKTCAPGRQNCIVHQAFCNIKAGAALDRGDPEAAKKWLDRNTDFGKWAWEYGLEYDYPKGYVRVFTADTVERLNNKKPGQRHYKTRYDICFRDGKLTKLHTNLTLQQSRVIQNEIERQGNKLW